MMKVAKIFLRLNAVILLVYALGFLFKPELLGRMVGFTAHSPNALVEVTAFYGGLEMGLAVFFFWGSWSDQRVSFSLAAFVFLFLAAGIFRVAGMLRFGFEDPSQPLVAAVEILFSLVALVLKGLVNKTR